MKGKLGANYLEAFGFTIACHVAALALIAALGYVWPSPIDDVIEVTLASGEILKPQEEPQKPAPAEQKPKQILEDEGIKEEEQPQKQASTAPSKESKVGDGGRDEFTSMPKILKAIKPDYPPAARNQDKEGRVLVELLISSRGVVEEAIIAKSGGFKALDEAVLKAVYKWRFAAAKNRYGRPCACKVVIPVRFQLK